MKQQSYSIEHSKDITVAKFFAMGSPCEIQIRCTNSLLIEEYIHKAFAEAWRIEKKFSRYEENNTVAQINSGKKIQVDEETARLIQYADLCFQLSQGLFDITSGVLRRAWTFKGQNTTLPSQNTIQTLLPLIGWEKIHWNNPWIQLPSEMEIDFGGIGKEYAADRVLDLLRTEHFDACMVNFGGDIAAYTQDDCSSSWNIGIEQPDAVNHAMAGLKIRKGGVATSGDSRRFIEYNNKKYGHILNPKTGWPIEDAPRSVTIYAENCTQAGMLATFAMLQGKNAEHFIDSQNIKAWIVR